LAILGVTTADVVRTAIVQFRCLALGQAFYKELLFYTLIHWEPVGDRVTGERNDGIASITLTIIASML